MVIGIELQKVPAKRIACAGEKLLSQEKAAEVIRDKAEEQNIMCLLHRALNPSVFGF